MKDIEYWLALHTTPGIGPARFFNLVNHFGSARAVFENASTHLHNVGLPQDTLSQLKSPNWERVEKNLAWSHKPQHHILAFPHDHYPARLREISDPPAVLFVKGNPALLNGQQLAVVGSRNPSFYGKQAAKSFAANIAKQNIIVTSGLATGIDGISHEATLSVNRPTIAVTGSGQDRIYPYRHRHLAQRIVENGALVSEFPLGTVPVAANFPRRNRIISGMSLGILIVEATLNSGSLLTARLANEQGRDVFAIPGSINNPLSQGCHKLIQEGAKLVENIDDVLEDLMPVCQIRKRKEQDAEPSGNNNVKSNTDGQSEKILHIMEHEPVTVDDISERTGFSAKTVTSLLLVLELQGKIVSSDGFYYRNA